MRSRLNIAIIVRRLRGNTSDVLSAPGAEFDSFAYNTAVFNGGLR